MRFRFWVQIAGLALLSVLPIFFIEFQNLGAWFQSPLSTVQPPGYQPPVGPAVPGIAVSPLPLAVERLADLFDAPIWASLWLWVAIGLIFFGGLALGLIHLVRRGRSSDR